MTCGGSLRFGDGIPELVRIFLSERGNHPKIGDIYLALRAKAWHQLASFYWFGIKGLFQQQFGPDQ